MISTGIGLLTVACLGVRAAAADTAAGGLARPTPEQAAWQDMELGMFIHFAPNTWQDKEGDDRSTPLGAINPEALDTDQWVRVAQSMGAKYIVFVAKHIGGFCMWQTDTTEYGIRNTPWRDGKGDVLADLAASCSKRGMKLGVYLSPRDDTLGAGIGGRCATEEAQERYNEIYRRQLTEVLSRYGDMAEVWFDGSNIIEVGDILREHAPHAVVFQGKYASIRWVGNEDGFAPDPAWNAVPEAARLAGATAANGDPAGDAWLPIECDARTRAGWFWSSTNADTLKRVDELMEMYYRSVGHGAVLLLNATPDTSGRIPEADAARIAAFGAEIARRFGTPLAETTGRGDTVELSLDQPMEIDHIVAMEDIRQGERVRAYIVEGRTDEGWRLLSQGTAIGHKKIEPIAPVEVRAVRLRITESAAEPIIRKLAVYCTARDTRQ
ncbi:MAG: alpha-L-fucosidase [Candidatus Hydrogenedentes bacterium]|nr:alpha-L-fucosidase [Candidatus Hydrogenedentota bacterium]